MKIQDQNLKAQLLVNQDQQKNIFQKKNHILHYLLNLAHK